jgi:serine/threonine protein kinase
MGQVHSICYIYYRTLYLLLHFYFERSYMPFDGLQLGNYRLLRLIGSGGMGEVYVAEDIRAPRQLAVKIARIDSQPFGQAETLSETIRLFHREMQVIIALDHPNILPLIDFGETVYQSTSRLLYIVMPYRPEGSLSNWLVRQHITTALPLRDAINFLLQAADALQHAHDHQIVHQDVKLANFLVREHSNRPRNPDLLLTDFGIARVTTSTSTQSLQFRGTPSAMPPEQWDGKPVPASDQYALAVMAYQLLTGRPPFVGGMQQIMLQHLMKQPDPPSQLNPLLPPGVNDVILRALAKAPEQRYPSILTFAQEMQRQSEAPVKFARTPIYSAESTPATLEPPALAPAAVIEAQAISQTPKHVAHSQTTIGSIAGKQETTARKPQMRALMLLLLAILLIVPAGIVTATQVQQRQMQSEQATAEAIQKTNLAHQRETSTIATTFASNMAATATAQATAACYKQGFSTGGPYALSPHVYLLPAQAPWLSTSSSCQSINVKFTQLTAPVQIQVCFSNSNCNAWVDTSNTNQWYQLATNVPAQTSYRFGIKATQNTTIQFMVAD